MPPPRRPQRFALGGPFPPLVALGLCWALVDVLLLPLLAHVVRRYSRHTACKTAAPTVTTHRSALLPNLHHHTTLERRKNQQQGVQGATVENACVCVCLCSLGFHSFKNQPLTFLHVLLRLFRSIFLYHKERFNLQPVCKMNDVLEKEKKRKREKVLVGYVCIYMVLKMCKRKKRKEKSKLSRAVVVIIK